MAFNVGAIVSKYTLDMTGFTKGIAVASAGFAFLGTQAEVAASRISSAGNRMIVTASLISAGIGFAANTFISVASEAEGYRIRLESLTRSQTKAAYAFKMGSDYAGKVSFEYREIMGAVTQLTGVMQGNVQMVEKWLPQ